MYAILDIETTGGKFNEEGITEIAIYKFDGHKIIDQFISLINPEKKIQDFVVKLTGINNKMLQNAPKFYEVAKRIIEITSDCILVAHNANFDYRVLKTEYKKLGYSFAKNTLCTVELSKKLILNQPSYSLGKLCKNLGIPITNRHRASGDALASVQLFKILLEKDKEKNILKNIIKFSDNRNKKKKIQSILDDLPEKQGVFYIHNEEGNVIFIGKGKNIKQEVNKLFLKTTNRAKNINKRVFSVEYEETGNNLFTKLKYYSYLTDFKPKYNIIKPLKRVESEFNNESFLIVNKGRNPQENAIILIENNEVIGYTYTNLKHQENNLDILKSIITPISNKNLAKNIIKRHLINYKVDKIIRL